MNIHILGICGAALSGIAVMLAKQGHTVTGSDQGTYPPATDYLDQHHISYFDHYDADHITDRIDRIIVGGNTNHLGTPNPELIEAQNQHIPTQSWAQFIGDLFQNSNRLVIAGTYGKTTITVLCSHIALTAGLNPSYLTTEKLQGNHPQIAYNPYSDWDILEGDEHPAVINFDDQPKFVYYQPTQVILTSIIWDHFNIYPTQADYIATYQKLLQAPSLQTLIVHDNIDLNQIANTAAKIIRYTTQNTLNDGSMPMIQLLSHQITDTGSIFQVSDTEQTIQLTIPLIGLHNIENALAAITWARYNQISWDDITTALETFSGIARRLQLKYNAKNLKIFHDFGQHPAKAAAAINSLNNAYPDHQLIIVLDPHASVLKDAHSLPFFKQSFNHASQVLIGKLQASKGSITGKQIADALNAFHIPARYLPKDDKLIQQISLLTNTHPSVILFLSSGNFRGLIDEFVNQVSRS